MGDTSRSGSPLDSSPEAEAGLSRHVVDEVVGHDETIADGVRLHYVEAGPRDGPPVLLLHGFPDFWYSWREQLPALAEAGYRILAPDMRGYNRSEKPHGIGAYRLESLAADVAAFLESLAVDPAYVVGHDWGGVVAWEAARAFPDVVDRLAILNAPHPLEFAHETHVEQVARSWYAFAFQLPWLPERALAARNFALLERLFREGTARREAVTDADLRRYRAAFRRPGALESALNYYRAFFRESAPTVLRGAIPFVGDRLVDPGPPVDAPTLVLWGEGDPALALERTRGLERYAERVRVERFPNAGHWVHLDEPERATEVLLEHFGR